MWIVIILRNTALLPMRFSERRIECATAKVFAKRRAWRACWRSTDGGSAAWRRTIRSLFHVRNQIISRDLDFPKKNTHAHAPRRKKIGKKQRRDCIRGRLSETTARATDGNSQRRWRNRHSEPMHPRMTKTTDENV